MAYEVVMPYHLHMPSYFLETFTEYPYIKIKKDTQEWKPPKCLISALLSFVAGPGIEPGTS